MNFVIIGLVLVFSYNIYAQGIDPAVKKYIDSKIEEESSKSKSNSFEFGGYFRTGTNMFTTGGSKNGGECISLNYPKNDGYYYRLGNECRDYALFNFNKNFYKNGIKYKTVFSFDIAGDSRGPNETEVWSRRLKQLYVEASNLSFRESTMWIGRKFYTTHGGMGDIHMLDTTYVQSGGNGFGFSDIKISSNKKAHIAIIGYGAEDTTDPNKRYNYQNYLVDLRFEFDMDSYGQFNLGIQNVFIKDAYDDVDLQDGKTLTVQWIKKLGIIDQKTSVQVGIGSMAKNPGCAGTDGACFDLFNAKSSMTGTRVSNAGLIHLSDSFKINYVALHEESEDYHKLSTAGVRPHYALNDHWNLEFEFAHLVYDIADTSADSFNTQRLDKYTISLQASADAKNYWERPSFRFYLSNFYWNNEASDQSGLNVPGFNSRVNQAQIIGSQVEVWF